MTKFNSHQKILMAFDSVMGDTLETAKAMSEKIVEHLWRDDVGHNGAIITHKIREAEWIINVVRNDNEFVINVETYDYTGTGDSVMMIHEDGVGEDKCVVRLARKITMILPAVKRLKEIKLEFITVEKLPSYHRIAFKTVDEITKAVNDERQ